MAFKTRSPVSVSSFPVCISRSIIASGAAGNSSRLRSVGFANFDFPPKLRRPFDTNTQMPWPIVVNMPRRKRRMRNSFMATPTAA
jgi:hypothetical protein